MARPALPAGAGRGWTALQRDGLRAGLLRDAARMRRQIGGAAARNFARWPILGRYFWPNPVDPRTGAYRRTWAGAVRFVRRFLKQRIAWMERRL